MHDPMHGQPVAKIPATPDIAPAEREQAVELTLAILGLAELEKSDTASISAAAEDV